MIIPTLYPAIVPKSYFPCTFIAICNGSGEDISQNWRLSTSISDNYSFKEAFLRLESLQKQT